MKAVLKVLWTIFKVLFAVVAVLFIVYFWNLDQKVLGWVYTRPQERGHQILAYGAL